MIPKAAITKAIEGGWKDHLHAEGNIIKELMPSSERMGSLDVVKELWAFVALDPTFWRSLGKALNWSENNASISAAPTWRTYAQEFYGLLLEERSTDDFWNDILNA